MHLLQLWPTKKTALLHCSKKFLEIILKLYFLAFKVDAAFMLYLNIRFSVFINDWSYCYFIVIEKYELCVFKYFSFLEALKITIFVKAFIIRVCRISIKSRCKRSRKVNCDIFRNFLDIYFFKLPYAKLFLFFS